MKYRHIERHAGQYSLRLMCRALRVTPQGYDQWRKRAESRGKRLEEEQRLVGRIRRVFRESRCTYGRIRVTKELRAHGERINAKRVGRLMRAEGHRAKAARKFKATTDSRHSRPVAPNRLNRDFIATAPNQGT